VTITSNAARVEGKLGGLAFPSTSQPESWRYTFNVTAGKYPLMIRDSQNGFGSIDTILAVPLKNDTIRLDFPDLATITVKANMPFDYKCNWSTIKGEQGKSFDGTASNSILVLRGRPKGFYRFTFENSNAEKPIPLEAFITADKTLEINFVVKKTKETITRRPERPIPTETHRLRIQTNPSSAEVIVDNVAAEQKTPYVDYLPKGLHSFKLIKAGYDTLDMLVFLNRDTIITRDLVQQTGYLMVTVNAKDGGAALRDAKIYVKKAGDSQEQYLGEAGKLANQSAELQAGRYTLRVERDGFNDERREILIGKGKTERLQITLNKQ
jgi:hypothetical protein